LRGGKKRILTTLEVGGGEDDVAGLSLDIRKNVRAGFGVTYQENNYRDQGNSYDESPLRSNH